MECTTNKMTIGYSWTEKNKFNLNPSYQRETGVWSLEKRQLFIDSLINSFDIPKIYLHDLRSKKEPISFAVVDGKQRLSTIWSFIEGRFKLSDGFKYLGNEDTYPDKGMSFQDFSELWKERFKNISVDVVYIQFAEEDDIEELFSRLNNGEPLNAAEKRNAMGGAMCQLIRETAMHPLFTKVLPFGNKRYSHFEVAAKLLKLEENELKTGTLVCDLKKRHLDELVETNRNLTEKQKKDLYVRVERNMNLMVKIFSEKDALLLKQSYPQMQYIFVKTVFENYGHPSLAKKVKEFLEKFSIERRLNNEKEEDKDVDLVYYGTLSMQGTNDSTSMVMRNEIQVRYFLTWNPDVQVKDPKRVFSAEERLVIWLMNNKKCAVCGVTITLQEMDADHEKLWAHGGPTTLENARCLCISCNRGRKA